MNILRPLHIFISTSPISLALLTLLVSATPIPSLDVVSKADANALIMRGPPISSRPQASSVDQAFAHGDQAPTSRLDKMTGKLSHPSDYYQPGTRSLAEDLQVYKDLIGSLSAADVKRIGGKVSVAIGHVKLFVAHWRSGKEQQDVIHGIKECEAEAVNKELPRWEPSFKPPNNLEAFFNGHNNDDFSSNNSAVELHRLVSNILSLTLKEYGHIREQLGVKRSAIEAQIIHWQPGPAKGYAVGMIMDWKAMGRLVDDGISASEAEM